LYNPLIFIIGPTAIGKSTLALKIAKKIDGEIINADSMQVYKDLNILTARPTKEDNELITHHLYGYVESSFRYNVSKWCNDIIEVIKNKRISVGAPYFNSTALPILLPGFLLMSVAPALSWQTNKFPKFKNYLFIFIFLSVATFIITFFTTFSTWGFVGILLSLFIITASLFSLYNNFRKYGFKNIIMTDSQGIIYKERENLNPTKQEMATFTNHDLIKGDLSEALKNSDIFIGVSKPNIVTESMIESMNKNPIVFALSNPVPEIMPDLAKNAGAQIVATGRSDFPNQVNNVLSFPGIFRGALDIRAKRITDDMKLAAAEALANSIENPSVDEILPYSLDKSVVPKVAEAVKKAYRD